MNPDTDIDTLKAIRARADAATAGPWEDLHGGSLLAPLHRICAGPQVLFYRNTTHPKTLQDAAFIAHARTDIPLLLDLVETLSAELAQTRENLFAGLDRDKDDITTPHLATVAINALTTARAQAAAAQEALRYVQRQAKVIQETRWGYDGDCGVGAIASRIEDVATAALTSPQGTGGLGIAMDALEQIAAGEPMLTGATASSMKFTAENALKKIKGGATCQSENDERAAAAVGAGANDAEPGSSTLPASASWRPIAEAPKDEDTPFLVLCPGNDVCDWLVVQVANFQGDMYPDHLGGNVDYGDRILTATHWQPLPPPPIPNGGNGVMSTEFTQPELTKARLIQPRP